MTVTTTLSPAPETAASTRTLTVRVRYFAAAGEAAGTTAETLALPGDATVADLRGALAAAHGAELARILGISALLIDGRTDLADSAALPQRGGELAVDVLPPFAGG